MSVRLEPHAEGVVLPVRAQPGGRVNRLHGVQAGALKVSVTQVAERGKANAAVIGVLCEALGLRRSQIELLSGETNRQKRFLVRGVNVADLAARIAVLAPS